MMQLIGGLSSAVNGGVLWTIVLTILEIITLNEIFSYINSL